MQTAMNKNKMPGGDDLNDKTMEMDEKEMSFSRIPSVNGAKWPQVPLTEKVSEGMEEDKLSQNPYEDQKRAPGSKVGLHKHKPSYSLSPSNINSSQYPQSKTTPSQ
mmetsp:Transcript_48925/g.36011  ORF Transcript_48925/g.36011 Transcript_48925/m.36011 type:complete len:106 (+) Transcript_48925:412-729(+)